MKKSNEVIIFFLGFVLLAEFGGAVVYRSLVNDNPRQENAEPERNYFNEEKTKNGIEDFDRKGGKTDPAGGGNEVVANQGEEQGVPGMDENKGLAQVGVGQDGSGEKAGAGVGESGMQGSLGDAIEIGSVVEEGKEPCTCGEKKGMNGDDEQDDSVVGSGQGPETQKNDLDDKIEENDDKIGAENEDAERKQPNSEMGGDGEQVEETTQSDSFAMGGIAGEPGSEKITGIEEIEEQDEMDKKGAKGDDTGTPAFKFSPLDR